MALMMLVILAPQASALTPEQEGAISQNCASINQSLKALQKTDARTRVYLGSVYQSVLTDFITPLNLRLVRNNVPNTDLVDDQSDFTKARNNFSHDFIAYSQSLEELIAADCQNHPSEFYDKLESTREKRRVVAEDVAKIQQLITEHTEQVIKLKESI